MYLFFDEFQRIDEWEDAINSFRVDFDCDIYIDNGKSKVNVKDYDEMKKGLVTRNRNLLFYFDGKDEKAAEGRIEMLFQP